jgi:hypothetical protein
MLIHLPAKIGQSLVILRLQGDIKGLWVIVQGVFKLATEIDYDQFTSCGAASTTCFPRSEFGRASVI